MFEFTSTLEFQLPPLPANDNIGKNIFGEVLRMAACWFVSCTLPERVAQCFGHNQSAWTVGV